MRLELLQRLWRIVDESETGCLSTTILCLQTEYVDLVFARLVEFGELGSEFVLCNVGTVGVENITVNSILDLLSFLKLMIPPSLRCLRIVDRTYTTICLRPRRGLRINLRVRRVTGWSAMLAFVILSIEGLPTIYRDRCRRIACRWDREVTVVGSSRKKISKIR
jgi:hypothetical protein